MQDLQYKESVQRGSFGFPIELYRLDLRHPRYVMNYHWHGEFELMRILQGSFSYTIEGHTGVAEAGDIVFVHGGLLHGGVPRACTYQCIVYDLGMLLAEGNACAAALGDFAEHRLVIQRTFPKQDTLLAETIHGVFDALEQKQPGYQLQTQGLLYQMFGRILAQGYYTDNSAENRSTQRKIRQLKKTLELIEREYAHPLTLEQLAAAAGMTPKYFCQFFHDMTKRSPIDYLNYHRIEVACFQLAMGHLSVTELAYECGFNDLSYFIRVFKRYKGTTPKRYAKQMGSIM